MNESGGDGLRAPRRVVLVGAESSGKTTLAAALAAELVLACADEDSARAAEEGADIVYHTLVALRAVGVTLDDLRGVLAGRAGGR